MVWQACGGLNNLHQGFRVWFAKTLHALHYNDFFLLGVTPSAWIAGESGVGVTGPIFCTKWSVSVTPC